MTALLMLMPGTPMLFQGQEFGATTPFLYFCDHKAELSKVVREGRAKFLAQFRSLSLPEMQPVFLDPGNPHTFEVAKLDFPKESGTPKSISFTKISSRFAAQTPSSPIRNIRGLDGAVLAPEAFLLRYFSESNGDRLLLVNFGTDLSLSPSPEPLLAPLPGAPWRIIWSSEDPRYGGLGTFPPETRDNWHSPGQCSRCSSVRRRPVNGTYTSPVRVLTKFVEGAGIDRPASDPGMAGDQWTRRLRLGYRPRRPSRAAITGC